jgi:hypothetical protein
MATASAILLIAFVLYSLKSVGFESHDFASRMLWIPGATLAVLTLPLTLFGKSLARLLAVFTGLLEIILLYIAGLATSY